MAHAGGGMFGAEALVVAQECPDLVLETSWVRVCDLPAVVEAAWAGARPAGHSVMIARTTPVSGSTQMP